jgi:hypothetical protein
MDPTRRIHWENAGYPGTIPEVPNTVDVKDYGAVGDGITDDFQAIAAAIAAAPNPGGIFLPQGRYKIRSKITLTQGRILRGAGAGKTRLEFNLGGSAENCIEIITYQRGDFTPVISGFHKGSTSLGVGDGSLFKPGDTAEIQQDNDPAVMYTDPEWNQSWAQDAVGQFFNVIGVAGNTLTIDRPLHLDFRPELNPRVRPNGLIDNVGIEDLHIKRLDAGDGHTILIKNAANCWVRRIESEYTYRSHVQITSSMNIELRENYFHHSHDYGGGGHGYGVDCSLHTTDCLIENNVFEHLRHSMMVHVGANGNVFAYNYSLDPFQNTGTWTPCDISIHGHYPFMNLFEGNILQEIGIGDYWGPAGPGNTFFRNRLESENIDVMDHSHDQNIVGNELTGGSNSISIQAEVEGTLVHGNNENGTIRWDPLIPDHVLPESYYLPFKPDFFGQMEWPSLGGDKALDAGTIPAKVRYESGSPVPGSSGDSSVTISSSGSGGSCSFTAVAHRSYLERHVQILRDFRDGLLLTNSLGRKFVYLYYQCSPGFAKYLGKHGLLRSLSRQALLPVVGFISLFFGKNSSPLFLLPLCSIFILLPAIRRYRP